MRVLCGYIDLNTRICGSTRIYAVIVATLWGGTWPMVMAVPWLGAMALSCSPPAFSWAVFLLAACREKLPRTSPELSLQEILQALQGASLKKNLIIAQNSEYLRKTFGIYSEILSS